MSNFADLLLLSNSIFPATGAEPFAGYIAIRENQIISVGKDTCPSEIISPQTITMNMGNRTITPGFIDTHCFFSGYAVGFLGIDLSSAKNCVDLISIVKNYALTLKDTDTIFGHGWDSNRIHPQGTKLLDDTFGSRPVILFAEGIETCWMNEAAIQRYDFTPETCYPESYVKIFPDVIGNRNFILPEFKKYMRMMNSHGITSVKEMGFDDFYGFTDVLMELEKSKDLTLRVNFMSQPVAEPMNLEYGKSMQKKFTGDFVHFSGYNQMTDGSISQLCGDLKQPYLCANTTCAQYIDWDLIKKDTLTADSAGFRFSLHAQGDAAIEKVLDIYQQCQRNSDGKLKNRHCITDLEFSDPIDIERMGKLGVIAEIYPQIQSIANRESKLQMIMEKIGPERGKFYWNRRKMADSHVVLSCGTDLPLLIDNIPESIYHAVGGYFPEGGEPFNRENMLTVSELLTAWTYGGAYNLSKETTLGSIENGKIADLVVLSDNVFETPIENIRSLNVDLTIVNGNIVYQK